MSNSQRTTGQARRPAIDHSRFLAFSRGQETGGAERIRTDDPLLAKQVLSQLSYSPIGLAAAHARARAVALNLVGQGRFELPTSRLSSARSNQLSY